MTEGKYVRVRIIIQDLIHSTEASKMTLDMAEREYKQQPCHGHFYIAQKKYNVNYAEGKNIDMNYVEGRSRDKMKSELKEGAYFKAMNAKGKKGKQKSVLF